MINQLLLATRNQGKVRELAQLLSDLQIQVLSLDDIKHSIPEIEETGTTFSANAALKAEQVGALARISTLADDSGLCIDALGGKPGVYSARYAPGSDADRCQKVLREMENKPNRKARFVCALVYFDIATSKTQSFTGECEGEIAMNARGKKGFGYDPIFIPKGYDSTFGELDESVKNTVSHRYRALKHFAEWIQKEHTHA